MKCSACVQRARQTLNAWSDGKSHTEGTKERRLSAACISLSCWRRWFSIFIGWLRHSWWVRLDRCFGFKQLLCSLLNVGSNSEKRMLSVIMSKASCHVISVSLVLKLLYLCAGNGKDDAYCSLLCLQAVFFCRALYIILSICLWMTLLSAAVVLTRTSGWVCCQWRCDGVTPPASRPSPPLSHAVKVLRVLMESINFTGSAELHPNGAWRQRRCNGHSSYPDSKLIRIIQMWWITFIM